jgi:hypothetical protein
MLPVREVSCSQRVVFGIGTRQLRCGRRRADGAKYRIDHMDDDDHNHKIVGALALVDTHMLSVMHHTSSS